VLKKKDTLTLIKKRSSTIADGDLKSNRSLNLIKILGSEEKNNLVVIKKPTKFTEHNKKIIEFNRNKNFGFFKNSKKLIFPNIFIADK
jgi:hypothetical protein